MDLRKACINCLSQVAGEIEDALVYLDAGAGEALHFMGGLAALLPFGPRAVCSLEHASPLDAVLQWSMASEDPTQKMLVITAHLLSDAHRYVLRCLRMHGSIQRCTILTSISEEAHSAHPDTPLGPDAFQEYRSLLLQDFQALVEKFEHTVERSKEYEFLARKNIDMESIVGASSLKSDSKRQAAESEAQSDISDRKDVGEVKEGSQSSLTVTVKHFPMILCPLTSKAFVFPSGGTIAEACLSNKLDNSLCSGLPGLGFGTNFDGEDHIPPGVTLLVHFLQDFSSQLDLKLDVFTLGPLAHLVGKVLTELSSLPDMSGRTKQSAGLLLIDRTLDLITPACHGDSLIDRFFSSLCRRNARNGLPRHSGASTMSVRRLPLDIRIPNHIADHVNSTYITETCDSLEYSPNTLFPCVNDKDKLQLQTLEMAQDDPRVRSSEGATISMDLIGGSLFDSMDSSVIEIFDFLFEKGTKEGTLMIRKLLQEALRKEKLNFPGRGRLGVVTGDEINSLWKLLAASSDRALRHAGLIHLARATEEAIGSICGSRWEAFESAEKVLRLSVSDSSQSVACQIRDMVCQSIHVGDYKELSLLGRKNSPRTQNHGLLCLRDALTLAIVGYALAGDNFGSAVSGSPFSWEDEKELIEAVVDVILEGPSGATLGFLRGLEDSIEVWQRQQSSSNKGNIAMDTPKQELQAHKDEENLNFDKEWEGWDDYQEQDVKEDEKTEEGEGYGKLQLKLELRDRLEEVFKVLHKVAEARKHLQIRDMPLTVEEKSVFPAMQRSLISKVLSLVFTNSGILGLEHHSSSVGRFFKSGLFGLRQAKPKLSDHKVLLVFVIGGINAVEIREAKEAVREFPGGDGLELLLGGTTFLTADDVYDLLLGSLNSM